MACFLLKSEWGERWMEENKPYQRLPGEYIVDGAIRWDCGPQNEAVEDTVMATLEKAGIPWGDAIAWVTKKIGIQQCAPCKARQEILNNASKNGWTETLRQIKETL
jgi:hypothetical protein